MIFWLMVKFIDSIFQAIYILTNFMCTFLLIPGREGLNSALL